MLVTVKEILENGYLITLFENRKSLVLIIKMEFEVGEVFELTELPIPYKIKEVGDNLG